MIRKLALLNLRLLWFLNKKRSVFGQTIKIGKIYVSSDYDKSTVHIFSMTLSDHTPNTMMFNAMRKYTFWKTFLDNYKLGNVYFENQRIKHSMLELIRMFYSK